MSTRTPAAISEIRREQAERRAEETDWLLSAIAGAIVAGRLPPDDARAWAVIATYEVAAMRKEVVTPCPAAT